MALWEDMMVQQVMKVAPSAVTREEVHEDLSADVQPGCFARQPVQGESAIPWVHASFRLIYESRQIIIKQYNFGLRCLVHGEGMTL